jgi:hypothetical protein
VREVIAVAERAYEIKIKKLSSEDVGSNSDEAKTLDLNPQLAGTTINWHPLLTQEQSIVLTMTWWKKILTNFQSSELACQDDIKQMLN